MLLTKISYFFFQIARTTFTLIADEREYGGEVLKWRLRRVTRVICVNWVHPHPLDLVGDEIPL